MCAAQDRHANTSAKRGHRAEEALADAASNARSEKKNLNTWMGLRYYFHSCGSYRGIRGYSGLGEFTSVGDL